MSVLSRCAGLPLAAAALVALSFAAQAADPTPPAKGNVLSLGGQGKPGGNVHLHGGRAVLLDEAHAHFREAAAILVVMIGEGRKRAPVLVIPVGWRSAACGQEHRRRGTEQENSCEGRVFHGRLHCKKIP